MTSRYQEFLFQSVRDFHHFLQQHCLRHDECLKLHVLMDLNAKRRLRLSKRASRHHQLKRMNSVKDLTQLMKRFHHHLASSSSSSDENAFQSIESYAVNLFKIQLTLTKTEESKQRTAVQLSPTPEACVTKVMEFIENLERLVFQPLASEIFSFTDTSSTSRETVKNYPTNDHKWFSCFSSTTNVNPTDNDFDRTTLATGTESTRTKSTYTNNTANTSDHPLHHEWTNLKQQCHNLLQEELDGPLELLAMFQELLQFSQEEAKELMRECQRELAQAQALIGTKMVKQDQKLFEYQMDQFQQLMKCTQYYMEREETELCFPIEHFGIYQVHSQMCQRQLQSENRERVHQLIQTILQLFHVSEQRLHHHYLVLVDNITTVPTNEQELQQWHDFCSYELSDELEYLKYCKGCFHQHFVSLEALEKFAFLHHNSSMASDIAQEYQQLHWNLWTWPMKIQHHVTKARTKWTHAESEMIQNYLVEKQIFEEQFCDTLARRIDQLGQADEVEKYEIHAEEALECQEMVESARGQIKAFHFREQVFHYFLMNDSFLDTLEDKLDPVAKFWITCSEFYQSKSIWMYQIITTLVAQDIELKMTQWKKDLDAIRAARVASANAKMIDKVSFDIETFSQYLPMLQCIAIPAIQPRHWEQIYRTVNLIDETGQRVIVDSFDANAGSSRRQSHINRRQSRRRSSKHTFLTENAASSITNTGHKRRSSQALFNKRLSAATSTNHEVKSSDETSGAETEFTLHDLVYQGLILNQFDAIEKISFDAQQEFKISLDLEKIHKRWYGFQFQFDALAQDMNESLSTPLSILTTTFDTCRIYFNHHMDTIEKLLVSPYGTPFLERLEEWKERVSEMQDKVASLYQFQSQWDLLSQFFQSSSRSKSESGNRHLQDTLSIEQRKFEMIDRLWNKTMHWMNSNPALHALEYEDVLSHSFERANQWCEEITNSLELYFEKKRWKYSRFFMVPIKELMHLHLHRSYVSLSSSATNSSDKVFQFIFPGCKQLLLESSNSINHRISKHEQEELIISGIQTVGGTKLIFPCPIEELETKEIEVWFHEMEQQWQASIEIKIFQSFQGIQKMIDNKGSMEEWKEAIAQYPVSIFLFVLEALLDNSPNDKETNTDYAKQLYSVIQIILLHHSSDLSSSNKLSLSQLLLFCHQYQDAKKNTIFTPIRVIDPQRNLHEIQFCGLGQDRGDNRLTFQYGNEALCDQSSSNGINHWFSMLIYSSSCFSDHYLFGLMQSFSRSPSIHFPIRPTRSGPDFSSNLPLSETQSLQVFGQYCGKIVYECPISILSSTQIHQWILGAAGCGSWLTLTAAHGANPISNSSEQQQQLLWSKIAGWTLEILQHKKFHEIWIDTSPLQSVPYAIHSQVEYFTSLNNAKATFSSIAGNFCNGMTSFWYLPMPNFRVLLELGLQTLNVSPSSVSTFRHVLSTKDEDSILKIVESIQWILTHFTTPYKCEALETMEQQKKVSAKAAQQNEINHQIQNGLDYFSGAILIGNTGTGKSTISSKLLTEMKTTTCIRVFCDGFEVIEMYQMLCSELSKLEERSNQGKKLLLYFDASTIETMILIEYWIKNFNIIPSKPHNMQVQILVETDSIAMVTPSLIYDFQMISFLPITSLDSRSDDTESYCRSSIIKEWIEGRLKITNQWNDATVELYGPTIALFFEQCLVLEPFWFMILNVFQLELQNSWNTGRSWESPLAGRIDNGRKSITNLLLFILVTSIESDRIPLSIHEQWKEAIIGAIPIIQTKAYADYQHFLFDIQQDEWKFWNTSEAFQNILSSRNAVEDANYLSIWIPTPSICCSVHFYNVQAKNSENSLANWLWLKGASQTGKSMTLQWLAAEREKKANESSVVIQFGKHQLQQFKRSQFQSRLVAAITASSSMNCQQDHQHPSVILFLEDLENSIALEALREYKCHQKWLFSSSSDRCKSDKITNNHPSALFHHQFNHSKIKEQKKIKMIVGTSHSSCDPSIRLVRHFQTIVFPECSPSTVMSVFNQILSRPHVNNDIGVKNILGEVGDTESFIEFNWKMYDYLQKHRQESLVPSLWNGLYAFIAIFGQLSYFPSLCTAENDRQLFLQWWAHEFNRECFDRFPSIEDGHDAVSPFYQYLLSSEMTSMYPQLSSMLGLSKTSVPMNEDIDSECHIALDEGDSTHNQFSWNPITRRIEAIDHLRTLRANWTSTLEKASAFEGGSDATYWDHEYFIPHISRLLRLLTWPSFSGIHHHRRRRCGVLNGNAGSSGAHQFCMKIACQLAKISNLNICGSFWKWNEWNQQKQKQGTATLTKQYEALLILNFSDWTVTEQQAFIHSITSGSSNNGFDNVRYCFSFTASDVSLPLICQQHSSNIDWYIDYYAACPSDLIFDHFMIHKFVAWIHKQAQETSSSNEDVIMKRRKKSVMIEDISKQLQHYSSRKDVSSSSTSSNISILSLMHYNQKLVNLKKYPKKELTESQYQFMIQCCSWIQNQCYRFLLHGDESNNISSPSGASPSFQSQSDLISHFESTYQKQYHHWTLQYDLHSQAYSKYKTLETKYETGKRTLKNDQQVASHQKERYTDAEAQYSAFHFKYVDIFEQQLKSQKFAVQQASERVIKVETYWNQEFHSILERIEAQTKLLYDAQLSSPGQEQWTAIYETINSTSNVLSHNSTLQCLRLCLRTKRRSSKVSSTSSSGSQRRRSIRNSISTRPNLTNQRTSILRRGSTLLGSNVMKGIYEESNKESTAESIAASAAAVFAASADQKKKESHDGQDFFNDHYTQSASHKAWETLMEFGRNFTLISLEFFHILQPLLESTAKASSTSSSTEQLESSCAISTPTFLQDQLCLWLKLIVEYKHMWFHSKHTKGNNILELIPVFEEQYWTKWKCSMEYQARLKKYHRARNHCEMMREDIDQIQLQLDHVNNRVAELESELVQLQSILGSLNQYHFPEIWQTQIKTIMSESHLLFEKTLFHTFSLVVGGSLSWTTRQKLWRQCQHMCHDKFQLNLSSPFASLLSCHNFTSGEMPEIVLFQCWSSNEFPLWKQNLFQHNFEIMASQHQKWPICFDPEQSAYQSIMKYLQWKNNSSNMLHRDSGYSIHSFTYSLTNINEFWNEWIQLFEAFAAQITKRSSTNNHGVNSRMVLFITLPTHFSYSSLDQCLTCFQPFMAPKAFGSRKKGSASLFEFESTDEELSSLGKEEECIAFRPPGWSAPKQLSLYRQKFRLLFFVNGSAFRFTADDDDANFITKELTFNCYHRQFYYTIQFKCPEEYHSLLFESQSSKDDDGSKIFKASSMRTKGNRRQSILVSSGPATTTIAASPPISASLNFVGQDIQQIQFQLYQVKLELTKVMLQECHDDNSEVFYSSMLSKVARFQLLEKQRQVVYSDISRQESQDSPGSSLFPIPMDMIGMIYQTIQDCQVLHPYYAYSFSVFVKHLSLCLKKKQEGLVKKDLKKGRNEQQDFLYAILQQCQVGLFYTDHMIFQFKFLCRWKFRSGFYFEVPEAAFWAVITFMSKPPPIETSTAVRATTPARIDVSSVSVATKEWLDENWIRLQCLSHHIQIFSTLLDFMVARWDVIETHLLMSRNHVSSSLAFLNVFYQQSKPKKVLLREERAFYHLLFCFSLSNDDPHESVHHNQTEVLNPSNYARVKLEVIVKWMRLGWTELIGQEQLDFVHPNTANLKEMIRTDASCDTRIWILHDHHHTRDYPFSLSSDITTTAEASTECPPNQHHFNVRRRDEEKEEKEGEKAAVVEEVKETEDMLEENLKYWFISSSRETTTNTASDSEELEQFLVSGMDRGEWRCVVNGDLNRSTLKNCQDTFEQHLYDSASSSTQSHHHHHRINQGFRLIFITENHVNLPVDLMRDSMHYIFQSPNTFSSLVHSPRHTSLELIQQIYIQCNSDWTFVKSPISDSVSAHQQHRGIVLSLFLVYCHRMAILDFQIQQFHKRHQWLSCVDQLEFDTALYHLLNFSSTSLVKSQLDLLMQPYFAHYYHHHHHSSSSSWLEKDPEMIVMELENALMSRIQSSGSPSLDELAGLVDSLLTSRESQLLRQELCLLHRQLTWMAQQPCAGSS